MKLTFTHEADFRRERDFGTKISATFEFIGAQFRPLFKCLVYFVLPGTLLFGIGMGLIFGNIGRLSRLSAETGVAPGINNFAVSYLSGMGLAILGATVSFLLLLGTVYSFVRVRMDTPATEVVQPAQVWAYIRARLGRIVLSWLFFSGVGVALFGALAAALFGSISINSGPSAENVLGIFGVMMVLGVVMTWLGVVLTQFFPILLIENVSIGTALRRSFSLIQGKWWSTFGVLFVATMIQSFVGYIFIIPMYAVIFAQALKVPGLDSPILSVVTGSIYAVGAVFAYVIPLVAVLFQYFNLVERKEGTGMRQLVDSLGQTAAPQVTNSYYRPDEEGEY